MSISFFVKRAFLNINPSQDFDPDRKIPDGRGHLMRVSSMIRGDQIVEYLGAKINPESGYENDICIYIKPHVRKGHDFKFEGKPYLDIIDGHNLGELAKKHPEVTVIVCSQVDYETMSSVIPNKIILIPQHHCNFDRIKRTRDEIKTVGVIGTEASFEHLPTGLREELAKRGMELITFSRFFTRQDILDFYQKIDVQIVWRPYKKLLSNPLKLVNAASFGIPTIALDEKAFKEMADCYIPVKTLEEFLVELSVLRAYPSVYNDYVKNCLIKAEKYHIESIANLYRSLT